MKNLTIDGERLWRDLMETAAIGGTPRGGICRLTLTELDREVRDWFKARAESLGCTVTVDDMGTMFARREGQRADVPPIAMGSHLDTQPTGGKFDGAYGVMAGLEVVRSLNDQGFTKFAAAPMSLIVIVVVTAIATLVWASLPARRAARLDVLKAISQD